MRDADLHLHTYHSDGTPSPQQVVDRAIEHRLGIIAISDHDNITAFHEIRDYAREKNVFLIPATELSCLHEGVDIHILAYAFDPSHEKLNARLASFRETRARRGEMMVEKLVALGYPVTLDRVRQLCGGGSMGRPHVARALVEIGACTSIQDAFDRFLKPGGAAYVDKERFAIPEAVALVREASGFTSVAHPTLYPDHRRVVPHLLDAGIDGIEVFHPEVDNDQRHHYEKLAFDRDKMLTGGSDDHGLPSRSQMGTIRVPEKRIRKLMERVW